MSGPEASIPAGHLGKLVTLGYLVPTGKGAVVTGDGLVHITESE